jgi:hypothetical protein
MADDFENKLTDAWRGFGKWNPPPLTPTMRRRLVGLPRSLNVPAFTLIWRAAGRAGEAVLEAGDLVRTVLAPPVPALLRGDAEPAAQVLECRLGDATLKMNIAPDKRGDGELRVAVSLEGGGEGNFNIELIDAVADDLIESRPLRQSASMTLREGGLYSLAVTKGGEEIGRVRFKLNKIGQDGEPSC